MNVTRRQFLKATAATAAVASVGGLPIPAEGACLLSEPSGFRFSEPRCAVWARERIPVAAPESYPQHPSRA